METESKCRPVNGCIDISELDLSQEMRDKIILAQINLLSRGETGGKEVAMIEAKTPEHAALFVGRIMSETLVKLCLDRNSNTTYTIYDVFSNSDDPTVAGKLLSSIKHAVQEEYLSVTVDKFF